MDKKIIKLLRITTVPISLKLLLTGQMKYMQENGIEVLMASADGPEIKEVLEREGCPHQIVPLTRQISPIKDLWSLILMIKLILQFRPDIVHSHTPKAGLIGMLAAWICRVPHRLHTIAGLPMMTMAGGKKKLLVIIEKLTSWAATKIYPNSQSIYNYMLDHHLAPVAKLSMIGNGSSNGIDLAQYSLAHLDSDKLVEIKQSINYDDTCKYIVAVGRVVKDKGTIELINSFIEVRKTYPNLRLLLLGPFENERANEQLPTHIVNEILNNKDIVHINWTENVAYYMGIADLFIHASHREGLPNVVLQAGAMECPIICSDIPGNIDIVNDGETGLYFEKGNSLDLINKLRFLLENLSDGLEKAALLRQEVEANFERQYIHKELFNLYQSLKHKKY